MTANCRQLADWRSGKLPLLLDSAQYQTQHQVEDHSRDPQGAVRELCKVLRAQGGELDVLRGALRTLDEAVVVTAEIQVFSERDTLVELLAFMQGNGWALYDITDQAYYPSDRTFYQCYATFIPKSMDFRKGSPWIQPGQENAVYEQLRARRASRIQALEALAKGG